MWHSSRIALLTVVSLLSVACSDDPPPAPVDGGSPADAGPSCTAGADGCACRPDSTCDAPGVCVAGRCVVTPPTGIKVSDPAARACEVLFRENGTRVFSADAKPGYRGQLVREEPSVAFAFAVESDQAIAAGQVGLRLSGPASGLTVREAHCFDRLGKPLPNAQVSFE